MFRDKFTGKRLTDDEIANFVETHYLDWMADDDLSNVLNLVMDHTGEAAIALERTVADIAMMVKRFGKEKTIPVVISGVSQAHQDGLICSLTAALLEIAKLRVALNAKFESEVQR